jgi:hypothetical protein
VLKAQKIKPEEIEMVGVIYEASLSATLTKDNEPLMLVLLQFLFL